MDSIPKQINQFYLPEWLTVELIASNFISFTPLFSYGTTILSIHKKQTSLGFSLDICATMIIASVIRVAYYFIIPYEIALLRQSIVMLFIQSILLKVSLEYRPKDYNSDHLLVSTSLLEDLEVVYSEDFFKNGFTVSDSLNAFKDTIVIILRHFVRFFDPSYKRIGKFWQWDSHKTYWKFLLRFVIAIVLITLVLRDYTKFGGFLGSIGLFIESLLPLPQILLLNRLKSVEGFKLILLLSWLGGDFTKISYLIFGAKNISAIFLFFALFQTSLDFYIGHQFIFFKYYFTKEPEAIELYDLKV